MKDVSTQHYFDIDTATEVGVNAAILYSNICYWVKKNRANDKNCHDGFYWTYCSIKGFIELFPYLSDKQIRTALQKLDDKGYILIGSYNQSPYDKTKWYTVPSDFAKGEKQPPDMAKASAPEGKSICPLGEPPSAPEGKCITDIKEDINSDINTFSENEFSVADDQQDGPKNSSEKKEEKSSAKKEEKPFPGYAKCCALYDTFHKEHTGIPPDFEGGITPKNIKNIIRHLKNAVRDKENLEESIPVAFEYILAAYENWPAFNKGRIKANEIYSDLTNIMLSIKNNGKSTSKTFESAREKSYRESAFSPYNQGN